MWSKKLSQVVLTVVTAILVLVTNISPGLSQNNDSSLPEASVFIGGREIFSVGTTGNSSAEKRAEYIRDKLLEAVRDDDFDEVIIEEQGRLPVLRLLYQRTPEQNPDSESELTSQEETKYLFTVTEKETIDRQSKRQAAIELKQKIEDAIAQAKKERTPAYIQRQAIIACILLVLTLLGSRLLDQLQTYPLRRAIQRVIPGLPSNTSSQASNLTTLFRLKLGFAQFALWLVTIVVICHLFPFTRDWLYLLVDIAVNTFNEPFFSLGGDDVSIIGLLILIGLLIISFYISNYIANLLRINVLQATRMTRGSQEIISIVVKYGLISFVTIVLLQAYGLNLSSLAFASGALGVGIGLGFQDIARNFASGLVLLFERSIQVGDFVQVGEHLGVVEEVNARSIVLKTLDRISIIVPNSRFLSEEVVNWNHRRSVSRLHLPIGVEYGSDVTKVKSALLEAAEEHLEILRNPAPQVFFTEFGDSSLNFELLVWTSDPSRQAPLKSDLYFRIEEIFREQQIQIPFPQRDIHFNTKDLPLRLSPQLEGHLLYLLKGLISQQYPNLKK